MQELQVFRNDEFGELEVLEKDGKYYFPATFCARKLGYINPQRAIREHCKGVNEMVTPTNGGKQTIKVIPEGDLYRLIIRSKLPTAEKFEKWVFDNVLPSIRETGGYNARIGDSEKLVRELTQGMTALVYASKNMINSVCKLETIYKDQLMHDSNRQEKLSSIDNQDYYGPVKCKLETFPTELREQVDEMLEKMMQQQSLNFSMISRYCTMNGYTISSPSVKTYFKKRFPD